jgi:hypothetical protein
MVRGGNAKGMAGSIAFLLAAGPDACDVASAPPECVYRPDITGLSPYEASALKRISQRFC